MYEALMAVGIGFGLLFVLILTLVLIASTKPNQFHFERSMSMNAPAAKIFPHIEDFHLWQAWSPFEKLDPNMKRTHSGAERGVGAIYEWSGNKKAGEGRMEVVETIPHSKIAIKLSFIRPFKTVNQIVFSLAEQAGTTNVTWSMEGNHILIGKIVFLFINMDKMLGRDFNEGLTKLKAIVEG